MNIVLIGPPGSGKGTQAKLIAKFWFLEHISTGDLLRDEVERKTSLGIEVSNIVASGKLVSDDIVLHLIKEKISSLSKKDFLLDGYPRNLDQALQLKKLLSQMSISLTNVIEFIVTEKELITRISNRQTISGRLDDSLEIAKERLKIYRSSIGPLLNFYKAEKENQEIKFDQINGMGTLDEVFNRIKLILK